AQQAWQYPRRSNGGRCAGEFSAGTTLGAGERFSTKAAQQTWPGSSGVWQWMQTEVFLPTSQVDCVLRICDMRSSYGIKRGLQRGGNRQEALGNRQEGIWIRRSRGGGNRG